MPGPLDGVRVLELAGLGPAPFASMLLADLGADVVRVDRPVAAPPDPDRARLDLVNRGKRSIALDLKSEAGRDTVRRLASGADVLIEGFRPGVTERLGLGPRDLLAVNPRLVYARLTGWGQDGPLAQVAGHDIDYLALTGALWATGRPDQRPTFALNLVGDFAGGSMFCVMGVLAALHVVQAGGAGQVVDAAMVDGVSVLSTMTASLRALGLWGDERGRNLLDGGAPYYEVYECADGRWLAVGALEPVFYAELVRRTGFRAGEPDEIRFAQPPVEQWDADRQRWATLFATRPRDEWATQLGESDGCAQPVLDWDEAVAHPQLQARDTHVDANGLRQPAPAPRFSRTVASLGGPAPSPGEHTDVILRKLEESTWPS